MVVWFCLEKIERGAKKTRVGCWRGSAPIESGGVQELSLSRVSINRDGRSSGKPGVDPACSSTPLSLELTFPLNREGEPKQFLFSSISPVCVFGGRERGLAAESPHSTKYEITR